VCVHFCEPWTDSTLASLICDCEIGGCPSVFLPCLRPWCGDLDAVFLSPLIGRSVVFLPFFRTSSYTALLDCIMSCIYQRHCTFWHDCWTGTYRPLRYKRRKSRCSGHSATRTGRDIHKLVALRSGQGSRAAVGTQPREPDGTSTNLLPSDPAEADGCIGSVSYRFLTETIFFLYTKVPWRK
jgi:hypothetical protein